MKLPLVAMYSGQGSQYFQMGKELREHAAFRAALEEGDALVRPRLGLSVVDEIYRRERSETFDDLRLSHPAIVMLEYALDRTLSSEGVRADQLWGSSLGEYVAAIAAGVWSLEAALDAVIVQAALVAEHCPAGGMLAVLAHPDRYAELKNRGYDITLAGVNFANHFTVAGDVRTLDEIQRELGAQSVTFLRLPVRYAFHSAAIEPIRTRYLDYLAQVPLARPARPFLSGIDGDLVDALPADYFWRVIREPMRFAETVARIERRGGARYVDVGPAGTSATFVKYNLAADSASQCHPLLTPFHNGAQKLAQLRQALAA